MSQINLTKLHNAPIKLQRLLAVGLLAMLLGLIGWLSWFMYLQLVDQADRIVSLRKDAGNLLAIVERQEALQTEDEGLIVIDSLLEQSLEGDTDAIARANLQNRLVGIADGNQVSVATVNNIPDKTIGETDNSLRLIGISISFNGKMNAVHEVIAEIEKLTPALFINEASFRLQNPSNRWKDDQIVKLSAQLKVYGFKSDQSASEFEKSVVENDR